MFETTIHWIREIEPHRVGMMARPRGAESLEAEVLAWKSASVSAVVCLLEHHEIRELELRDESTLCAKLDIKFHHFPIRDRGVPESSQAVAALVGTLHANLISGLAVALHCRAGIGRTGLISACLLHALDTPHHQIFSILSKSRGLTMPDTDAQIEWVKKYVRTFPSAREQKL
jgi:protein-tyrosine phosphatase